MINAVMDTFFHYLLTMSICGSILILLLFALKLIIRDKTSKSIQYYLWIIVFAQFIIPYSATFTAPPIPLAAETISHVENANYENMLVQYNQPVYTVRDAVERYVFAPDGAETTQKILNPSPLNSSGILMILWTIGAAAFLGFHLTAYAAFSRRINRTLKATDIHAGSSRRKVQVYKSCLIKTPMLMGLFRAKIVLPDRAYRSDELHNILMHEMVHYRRCDLAVKWFITIVNAIHWFNPLVYFARRELGRASELSCDEAVIKKLDEDGRQSYGDTLISVVAESRYPKGVVSTTMCEDRKKLQERLLSIMKHKKNPKTAMVLSIILAAALLTVGVAMSASSIAPSGLDGTIPLASTTLADMDTGLMMRQIMDATNAKSDDTFLGEGPTINLTGDYRWEQTNMFQIFVSMNQAGGQPYMRYQMEIQSETMDIEMFAQDGDYIPDARIKLSALLDALKYIPTEHVNGLFDATPDKYIIRAGINITNGDEIPRVYYNRYGITGLSGWFVQLELTPLYESANGGYAGSGDDVVLLCYGDAPDVASLPAALPQDETFEETAPELSRFDALPDTITRDIIVEGFAEPTTLTKYVFGGVAALYLDADTFQHLAPSEEANLGGALAFDVDKPLTLSLPRIEVSFIPDSDGQSWLESMRDKIDADPNARVEERTLGANTCTMLEKRIENMTIHTYSIDHMGGRIAITVRNYSGSEYEEGWGSRLAQMLDTLELNQSVLPFSPKMIHDITSAELELLEVHYRETSGIQTITDEKELNEIASLLGSAVV